MADPSSAFARAGGEAVLRPLLQRFVARLASDPMIGFLFRDADLVRLAEREYQHAAQHLGGDVPYTGRPLRAAHAPFPITGGMFARRRRLLELELTESGVPADIMVRWLAHQDALRPEITPEADGHCGTRATGGPKVVRWEPPEAKP